MVHRSRKPLRQPEALEAILSRAGESRFARTRAPIPPSTWRQAVGPRIAERATPVCIQSGVLVLRVPSSVWAHELSLLSEELCARLLQHGVTVSGLRFRVGVVPAVERPPERRGSRAIPSPGPIPRVVAAALDEVADEPLREAIASAAAANLAWQASVAPVDASPISEAMRGARAPRFAGEGSALPDPGSPGAPADAPRTRGGGPDRSR